MLELADRFYPEAWTKGAAQEGWTFNHLTHAPQGCWGVGLALFLGRAPLAALLARRGVLSLEPTLDPDRSLPHMLDFFHPDRPRGPLSADEDQARAQVDGARRRLHP